jgi:N-acetylglucosamine kinase-like BadF-type ATPase
MSDMEGRLLARAATGPGNPSAIGGAAATAIGTAIRTALGDHDPARVRAAVVGLAGVSALSDPAVAAAFDREWQALGLRCPVDIVGDAVTAFAAGTTKPAGAVLIAGTGAVAALIDDVAIIRTADGLGWLLGDEGSGLWLGLQAVRVAAREFRSPLGAAVAAHAGVRTSDELVHWAGRVAPATFATLAPLVCTSTDPRAHGLTSTAAARLIATLDELGAPPGPVVLAGSLLTADTPVRAKVRDLLTGRGTEVRTAGEPALGALRLAVRRRRPAGRPGA